MRDRVRPRVMAANDPLPSLTRALLAIGTVVVVFGIFAAFAGSLIFLLST